MSITLPVESGHVAHAVEARVERGGHLATDGGLAAARLAGDEADASQVEEMARAHLQLGHGGGGEENLDGEIFAALAVLPEPAADGLLGHMRAQ